MKKLVLAAALVAAQATQLFAAEGGTREEAIAMVERAEAVFAAEGLETLKTRIMDGDDAEFHDRDLYASVYNTEGVILAHGVKPELVGRNLMGLKDQNGVALVRDMIAVAMGEGAGWVDYHWPNPTTDKVEAKSAYAKKLDDGTVVSVGIYKGE